MGYNLFLVTQSSTKRLTPQHRVEFYQAFTQLGSLLTTLSQLSEEGGGVPNSKTFSTVIAWTSLIQFRFFSVGVWLFDTNRKDWNCKDTLVTSPPQMRVVNEISFSAYGTEERGVELGRWVGITQDDHGRTVVMKNMNMFREFYYQFSDVCI